MLNIPHYHAFSCLAFHERFFLFRVVVGRVGMHNLIPQPEMIK